MQITTEELLYLLGVKGMYTVRLRSWLERIEILWDNRHYTAAVTLAQHFYNGILSVVTDMPIKMNLGKARLTHGRRTEHRQTLIADKVVSLVINVR